MRHALILLVFLSGCVTLQERTDEVTPISAKKRIVGGMIIERIKERVGELAEEQSNLIMVIEQIKADLKANDEWIRSGREVDPKEIYRF
jgi:hypothetical protein